jgi:hypothetical protein
VGGTNKEKEEGGTNKIMSSTPRHIYDIAIIGTGIVGNSFVLSMFFLRVLLDQILSLLMEMKQFFCLSFHKIFLLKRKTIFD